MSLSLDLTVLWTNATAMIQILWPVVGIGAGFSLGFMLLRVVQSSIAGAFRGGR